MRDGWNAGVISITVVLSFAFLLSVAGIILLLRGKAAGGIVGAVGSAFFVPIGLICLLGCLQSRADILREGLMPAATPSVVREQERPAEAQPSAMPDEQAEQNEQSDEQQLPAHSLTKPDLLSVCWCFFRWLPWEFFPGANRS